MGSHLPAHSCPALELTPCQPTGKGDFRPAWEIGLLGGLGSLDLLGRMWSSSRMQGGVCRVGPVLLSAGRGMWGLWDQSFPLSLPFLFLRDSPHSPRPETLLMAGAGEVRRLEIWAAFGFGFGFGQQVGAQTPAPPIPPLLLPSHPLPARPLEQNPASTVQFLLEQIVAGIVGYLNPHIISSSVLL